MIITLGDKVITKKPHACGSSEWTVTRTGADIKLTCARCGRVVMLPLDKALKSIKRIEETK
jgi:hypothetical protein